MGPGERIELLGGLLVVREPQGGRHAMGVRMVEEALRAAFGSGWDVRGQLPVALDEESEPEPDVSVVPGSFRDYPLEHPARAVLVVEIADSSLALDRGEKAGLYARARVPDYWIVNLVDRALEVHRDPARDAGRLSAGATARSSRSGQARRSPRSRRRKPSSPSPTSFPD